MSTNLGWNKLNRWILALKAKESHIKDYIGASCDLSGAYREVEMLSVDMEMTGLNPKNLK